MAFQELALAEYNKNSYWQLVENLKKVESFLEHTGVVFSKPLVRIGDFGCSEGGNSVRFFAKVLESLRGKENNSSVSITHCDLPENNWAQVNKAVSSPDSYLRFPNSFSSFVGRSFFSQLFPSSSLDIAWSAFSFHYLSRPAERAEIESKFYHKGIEDQGMADLVHLLRLRITELVPGGYFVGLIGAQGEEKPVLTETIINETFGKMISSNYLTPEELGSMQWNTFVLDEAKWATVLNSIPEESELVHFSISKSNCPYYTDYLADNDLEKYIEGLSGYYYVLIQHVIRSCLKREDKETSMKFLLEYLKQTMREHIGETFMHVAYLIIRKKY